MFSMHCMICYTEYLNWNWITPPFRRTCSSHSRCSCLRPRWRGAWWSTSYLRWWWKISLNHFMVIMILAKISIHDDHGNHSSSLERRLVVFSGQHHILEIVVEIRENLASDQDMTKTSFHSWWSWQSWRKYHFVMITASMIMMKYNTWWQGHSKSNRHDVQGKAGTWRHNHGDNHARCTLRIHGDNMVITDHWPGWL